MAVAEGYHRQVSDRVAKILQNTGILEKEDGFSYQMGAGKIPLDVARQLTEIMENNPDIRAKFTMGGANAYHFQQLEKGFLEVVSGPFVRSSYRADRVLEKNNAGLANLSDNSNDKG